MSELFDCRLCAKLAPLQHLKKLFDRAQSEIVQQITELTGIRLKNNAALPEHICQQCLKDLEQAHAFRSRCLEVISYFNKLENQQTHEFDETNVNKEFELAEACNNITTGDFTEAVHEYGATNVKKEFERAEACNNIKTRELIEAVHEYGATNVKKEFELTEACNNMKTRELIEAVDEFGATNEFEMIQTAETCDNMKTIGEFGATNVEKELELEKRTEACDNMKRIDINDGKNSKLKKSKNSTKEGKVPKNQSNKISNCEECGHFMPKTHLRRDAGDRSNKCA